MLSVVELKADFLVTFQGGRDHYDMTRELVHFVATQHGLTVDDADVIERATAEACHNALYHESDAEPFFNLELRFNNAQVTAVIRNRGEAFNFDDIEPFSIHHNFLEYKNGGLGIPIMKAIMDEVRYERKPDNLNEVTLIKYINKSKGD